MNAPRTAAAPAAVRHGAAALALLLLVGHGLLFRFVVDDAFISLRYAANLVAGDGLVFNPGEPVEGYSNLLWVLLAATGIRLGVAPLLWLRILGVAAMGGLLWLVPGALDRLRPAAAARAPFAAPAGQLLIAACGPAACWMLGGLETPLFALLTFAAWRAALGARALSAAVLGVLLVLTRPEGPALGAAVTAWALLPAAGAAPTGANARRLGAGALFLAGTALFLLWRHHTYGLWLPNTYYAKTGDLAGQLRTGWPYALDFVLRFGLPLALVVAAAAARGGAATVRGRPLVLTGALLAGWLAYTVAVGGDMLGMFRFYAPLLPVALTATVAGVAGAGWLDRLRPALLAVALLAAVELVSSFQGRERRLVAIHMREANLGGWMLAGDAMAEQLPAGTSIALGPAGYIPWRTGFYTLDFYGIVTPAIAHRETAFRHGYAGHEKTDGPWIVARRPDYILIGNVDITDAPRTGLIPPLDREVDIVLDKRFQREYEQVWLPVAGGKALNLFRRRDLVR